LPKQVDLFGSNGDRLLERFEMTEQQGRDTVTGCFVGNDLPAQRPLQNLNRAPPKFICQTLARANQQQLRFGISQHEAANFRPHVFDRAMT
jgi:hypothetical protein